LAYFDVRAIHEWTPASNEICGIGHPKFHNCSRKIFTA
jgi:hypothetical protein